MHALVTSLLYDWNGLQRSDSKCWPRVYKLVILHLLNHVVHDICPKFHHPKLVELISRPSSTRIAQNYHWFPYEIQETCLEKIPIILCM